MRSYVSFPSSKYIDPPMSPDCKSIIKMSVESQTEPFKVIGSLGISFFPLQNLFQALLPQQPL